MLLSCSLVSCGEPIKSAENDPLFTATEPAANVPQGEMMIETAVSQRAYIAPTTTVTVKREKQEYRNVVITKKEILEAAGISEVYLNYGYADVDAVSVNYGELNVLRDSDAYTIPEGYGLHYGMKLVEITPTAVIAENVETGEKVTFEADTVLLALGMKAKTEEAETLRHCAPETDVRVIGDAKRAAQIFEAVNEAFQASLHI